MAALTYNCKFVNLSYVNDTLTFYPTFEYYKNPGLRNCLDLVLSECNKLEFVIKTLPNEEPSKENKEFISCLNNIQKSNNCNFEKFVRRNDSDHSFYHRDHFKLSDSHWHIKFGSLLKPHQIGALLDIFTKYELMDDDEKNKFLIVLSHRYQDARNSLDAVLRGLKTEDTNAIIQYVAGCLDNDILANLHAHMLTKKFNYIREIENPEQNPSCWVGVNELQQISMVSKNWANIEKAITLQMAHNTETQCSRFTPFLGRKQAEIIANSCSFFPIKHKPTGSTETNATFDALKNADKENLEKQYQKFYGRGKS